MGPLLFLTYINCVANLRLSEGTILSMYADDILLWKPIKQDSDYIHLQADLNLISSSISNLHLSLNATKCKYIVASRKKGSNLPSLGLYLDGEVMQQVSSYVTRAFMLPKHSVGLSIYRICAPKQGNFKRDIQLLESVQRFACKVCLKYWDMDYVNMLHCLDLPTLVVRRQHLKLMTMYNIINGKTVFPAGIFNLREHTSQRHFSSLYNRLYAVLIIFTFHLYLMLYLYGMHCP